MFPPNIAQLIRELNCSDQVKNSRIDKNELTQYLVDLMEYFAKMFVQFDDIYPLAYELNPAMMKSDYNPDPPRKLPKRKHEL